MAKPAESGRPDGIIRLDEISPAVDLKLLELFEGAEGLMWYLDQIAALLNDLQGPTNAKTSNIFRSLVVASWAILFNLHEECGISRADFLQAYTPPMNFEAIGEGLFAVKVKGNEEDRGKTQAPLV